MKRLLKGQRVVISGANGVSHGTVLEVLSPDRFLPEVGGPDPELARESMRDLGIKQVALIEFLHNGKPVCFCALGNGEGRWRDLQQQELTITAHGQEN